MPRPRTGSVRYRNGVWYVGLRLRSGKWHERKIDPPRDGSPYDETYARLCAAQLSRAYATGEWDPERSSRSRDANATAAEYVQAWLDRQTYESAPKEQTLIRRLIRSSPIGAIRVRDVRPIDAVQWIEWLKRRPSSRGGTISPSVVRNAYDLLQRAFDDATLEEIRATNPLRIARKKLPAKGDKRPGARAEWTFTREEIVALITDERIAPWRRVRYALQFLTGMRFGECAALRWRDWDRNAEPLGRITVARAIKSVSRVEGGTKTGAVKFVPVHPTLAKILTDWHARGWREAYGRAPTADDLVAPVQRGPHAGRPPVSTPANVAFRADQRRLGMRERHQHVARHAFITLAQNDGADGSVLRWATHAPPRSAFDGYSRAQWDRLCAEVSKLNVGAKVGKRKRASRSVLQKGSQRGGAWS